MSRRHTFSNVVSDYPEHLNPFREENPTRIDADEGKENNVNSFGHGRRNSRLSASFRVKNWAMFTKKSKGSESNEDEAETTKAKSGRFSTLTPQLSRRIMEVLSPKRRKEKVTPPPPQYSTLPARRPVDDSVTEFKLIKPNRQRFAPRVQEVETTPVVEPRTSREPPVPEPRLTIPPVPMPRTTLSRAGSAIIEPQEQVVATIEVNEVIDKSNKIAEDEESKYIRQGARPKKKRQAPLPPSASQQIYPTLQESDTSHSASISSTSPSPEPNARPVTQPDTPAEAEQVVLAVEETKNDINIVKVNKNEILKDEETKNGTKQDEKTNFETKEVEETKNEGIKDKVAKNGTKKDEETKNETKRAALAVEEIDFSVKLYIDDDL